MARSMPRPSPALVAAYSFTGLAAGTYRVREVGQVGWTQTTVNPGDVSVVSGTNSTGNNFGNFQLGSLSGKKFNDVDGDGTDDGGSDAGSGRLDDSARQGCQRHRRCHDRHRPWRRPTASPVSRPARIGSAKSARSAGFKRPSIRATSPSSAARTAPDNNFGNRQLVPGIDLEKTTNGPTNSNPTAPDYDNEDSENGPGVPILTPGSTVTWTYKVTNTGETRLRIQAKS